MAELVFRREKEAILEQKVAELTRISTLKDERLELLLLSIKELEAAIEARKKAEGVVDELRVSYQKQVALAEKEIANQKRKVKLWQLLSAVAVLFALITGTRK